MKEIAKTVKSLLIGMSVVRAILYSLVMLGSCWLTALNKLSWSDLSWDDQRNILIGIFVSWATAMIAFLDKSANQIAQGKIPGIETGDEKVKLP